MEHVTEPKCSLISYRRKILLRNQRERWSWQPGRDEKLSRKEKIINRSGGTISKHGNRDGGGGENKRSYTLSNQK